MFRTLIAAAAALTLTAPAMAQTTSALLTQESWSCRMTSLVGEPGGDLMIAFGDNASFYGAFYIEVAEGEDVISMEFDVAGSWTLDGAVISMVAEDSEVVGAWINDEPLEQDVVDDVAASLSGELANFAGESTIAYIADHAMVLDEPDTSISCWR